MKKLVSMALALLLVLSAVPAMAETESGEGTTVGVLSYLTLTEDDYLAVYEAERGAREYLIEQGVVEVVTLGVRVNCRTKRQFPKNNSTLRRTNCLISYIVYEIDG